jgi:mannose-1-phosphate guanylyltransferase
MFIFAAGTLMTSLERYQPALFLAVERIADAWETPDREPVMAEVWSSLRNINIDEGIMEPAAADGRVAVVPAEFGWSDVGDWHGLGELIEHDGLGNSVRGDFLQLETHDCVVWSETGRVVALIGMDNVVVVDTDDALLVIDRSRAQDVRKVVDELKAQARYELS